MDVSIFKCTYIHSTRKVFAVLQYKLLSLFIPIFINKTKYVHFSCSEPLELSGMSILAFRNPENAQLMCDRGQSTNSISRNVTKMCISFLVIGIIIVISATIGLTALYFVKQRTNRALNFEFLKVPNIRYIKMKFSSWGNNKPWSCGTVNHAAH